MGRQEKRQETWQEIRDTVLAQGEQDRKEREEFLQMIMKRGLVNAAELWPIIMQERRRLELIQVQLNGRVGQARRALAKAERQLSEVKTRQVAPADKAVYVIGATGGAMKIGIAEDPHKRLSGLQTGRSDPLRLYYHTGPIPDARSVESQCHLALSDYHVRGEWFDVDPREAIEVVKRVTSRHLEHNRAA